MGQEWRREAPGCFGSWLKLLRVFLLSASEVIRTRSNGTFGVVAHPHVNLRGLG